MMTFSQLCIQRSKLQTTFHENELFWHRHSNYWFAIELASYLHQVGYSKFFNIKSIFILNFEM